MKTTSNCAEKGYCEHEQEERKLLLLMCKNTPAMMSRKQMEKTMI